ncbi:MAG: transcriptional regulator [Segetibacter sp.]|nr:transcriptional regulator [Segetibacter sp.]
MRQLDFFASLFESETAEKPAEKKAARKSEPESALIAKRNGLFKEPPTEIKKEPISFSLFDSAAIEEVDLVGSATAPEETFEDEPVEPGTLADTDSETEAGNGSIAIKPPDSYSLFDLPVEEEEQAAMVEELIIAGGPTDKKVIEDNKEPAIEIEDISNSVVGIEKEQAVKEESATTSYMQLSDEALRYDMSKGVEEIADSEPALDLFPASNTSVSETIVERPIEIVSETVVIDKAFNERPEGETRNSEIFNDGKISVRIKAKPQPVKEKKVAVKEVEPIAAKELPASLPKTQQKKKQVVQSNTSGLPATREKAKKFPKKRGRKSFKEIDAEVDLIEVPDEEALFQKQYYSISTVAKWFRVNTSLLRFWENEFDVLKPRKNRKGDRLFRPEDVKNLQLIYHLLRQRKYTIEGAKEYLKTHKKKADLQMQLTNTLQKFKGFLLELRANLQQ